MRCICIQQNFGIAHIEIITFCNTVLSLLLNPICVCVLFLSGCRACSGREGRKCWEWEFMWLPNPPAEVRNTFEKCSCLKFFHLKLHYVHIPCTGLDFFSIQCLKYSLHIFSKVPGTFLVSILTWQNHTFFAHFLAAHPWWKSSIFHHVLRVLYWIEIWSMWRPFDCSELIVMFRMFKKDQTKIFHFSVF